MSFYNSVKDRVRDEDQEDTDEDTDHKEDGPMAFDELVKKAEKQDDDDDEEPDDTEIEDFSGGGGSSSDDYGDPSSIELDEQSEPQAGDNTSQETSQSQRDKAEDDSEVEIHSDGSVTEPGEEDEVEEPRPVDGKGDVTALLQEIRNQNDQIISVLRDIRERM